MRSLLKYGVLLLLIFPTICLQAQQGFAGKGIMAQYGAGLGYVWGGAFGGHQLPSYSPTFVMAYQQRISPRLWLRAGIGYKQVDSRHKVSFSDEYGRDLGNGFVRFRHHTMQIPLQLGMDLSKKGPFYISTGFFIAPMLKSEGSVSGNSDLNMEAFDVSDQYRKMDFGVLLAFGASIPWFDRNRVVLELEDQFGLVNILADRNPRFPGLHTHIVQLKAGLYFTRNRIRE